MSPRISFHAFGWRLLLSDSPLGRQGAALQRMPKLFFALRGTSSIRNEIGSRDSFLRKATTPIRTLARASSHALTRPGPMSYACQGSHFADH